MGTILGESSALFPGFARPELSHVDPAVPEQRVHADAALRARGILETRWSLELEQSLIPRMLSADEQRVTDERVAALRQRIFAHMNRRVAEARTPEERATAERERAAVETFGAKALLLFELHDLHPETSPVLQRLFGEGRGDGGYYDAPGLPEFKLKPVPSGQLQTNVESLLRVIQEKAAEYGFDAPPPSPHLNASFWDADGNVCNPRHPRFTTVGGRIASGVARAVSLADKAVPLHCDASIGPDRKRAIRMTGEDDEGRMEFRLQGDSHGIALMHLPSMIEGVIKPGATQGLDGDRLMPAASRAVLAMEGGAYKMILHAMQGSLVESEGPSTYRLKPPERYVIDAMRKNSSAICRELGKEFVPELDKVDLDGLQDDTRMQDIVCRMHTPDLPKQKSYEDFVAAKLQAIRERGMGPRELLEFFQGIRIREEDGRYQIVFPGSYRLFGESKSVDAAALSRAIRCEGIVPTLVAPHADVDKAEVAVSHLASLQADFRDRFQHCLKKGDVSWHFRGGGRWGR